MFFHSYSQYQFIHINFAFWYFCTKTSSQIFYEEYYFMEDLNKFASQNFFLIFVWFALLFMIINSFLKGKWDRSPQQVVQLLNNNSSILLDVRENNEYSQGHIVNSMHIPQGEVKKRLAELEKYKDGNVVVSCRSGARSSSTCSMLKKQGFKNVFNLRGGIMAWENENLPITKKGK